MDQLSTDMMTDSAWHQREIENLKIWGRIFRDAREGKVVISGFASLCGVNASYDVEIFAC
jgi:hypothetical protein